MANEFVAGHVIFGVGMIAACVSTVAASSSHFLLIRRSREQERWNTGTGLFFINRNCLIAVPVLLTLLGFIWVYYAVT